MSRIEGMEPAASAAGTKALATTLTGAGALGWGGYTANDIAMVVGALVAVLGLVIQTYFSLEAHKMRRREHEARMAERGFYDQG